MGQDTRLRAKTKEEYDSGAGIYEIIHPITKGSNPNISMPNSTLIKGQLLEGNFINVKSNRGHCSNIINKITYDLEYAKRVYLAFSIDPLSESATAQLQEALTTYEISTENRDNTELQNDILKDTVKVLKRSNVSAVDIENAFTRTSIIQGIITLELLANYIKVDYNSEVTNSDLAALIKVVIDSI
tara:strand:+ start:11 stop:568 length:558 start_codon:yes stop_codon:yes gene_type:complete